MKMMKKLSVILLSFGMMLMLTAPALAMPSGSYAVLNVRYAPDGQPQNAVEVRLCKVADASRGGDGGYTYELTEDFSDAGIDLNSILDGRQVTSEATNTDTNRSLLLNLGTYINQAVQDGKALERLSAYTDTVEIGPNSEPADGVAQFTGLSDGLYLGYVSGSTSIGTMRYTAVPFLLNIPYEDAIAGVSYNYMTATLKFTQSRDTTSEEPPPVDPGPDPGPGPGPGPSRPDPAPAVPDPEPAPVDPAPVPEEEYVEILPEEVPLEGLPEDEGPVEIEILPDEVPLANLPQTGLLWWPVPVMAAGGIACLGLGVCSKKRSDRDE